MSLHTDLTVIERHRHSYDVFPDSNRTQPFGSGATCYYNYIDLIIKNNTDRPCRLSLKLTDTELCGQWQCGEKAQHYYEVYEKEHLIRHEFWGAYTRHNTIYRKKYDMCGCIIADEFIVENHAFMMYEPLIGEDSKQGSA